jgi:magnesium-transporting ATPase (P-type)
VALGLVISFEPHELDVMNRPPRAVDRPILTGFGIWRVVFVGLALLAVTLWAFFWMKSHGASDQLARTVAVNMITIGQVFYLLNTAATCSTRRSRQVRTSATSTCRSASARS